LSGRASVHRIRRLAVGDDGRARRLLATPLEVPGRPTHCAPDRSADPPSESNLKVLDQAEASAAKLAPRRSASHAHAAGGWTPRLGTNPVCQIAPDKGFLSPQTARFWADWGGTVMEQRGRNRWQTFGSPKGRKWLDLAPTVATGCHPLPFGSHGKQAFAVGCHRLREFPSLRRRGSTRCQVFQVDR
jgi:hypothetical protein